MEQEFDVDLAVLNKKALVKKSPYDLSIIREGLFSVSVIRMPLIEYFVLIDQHDKKEQIKLKLYRTTEGKWYDSSYSEEAESNSPEFGNPQIVRAVKQAIDLYEPSHIGANQYMS